ncbi:MAG TPA: hypothetical protein VKF38_16635 [Anaerolineaceae bacterium]|nr:hypothetical protein [Anaerolineaceae bacterium]
MAVPLSEPLLIDRGGLYHQNIEASMRDSLGIPHTAGHPGICRDFFHRHAPTPTATPTE